MTIDECIQKVQAIKPNSFSDDVVIWWLNNLDQQFYNEVVMTHEGHEEVEQPKHTTVDDELLIPEPWSAVYVYWVVAQIDFNNQEYGLYQNSSTLYNEAYTSARNWYNREHMPLHTCNVHYTGYKKAPEGRGE